MTVNKCFVLTHESAPSDCVARSSYERKCLCRQRSACVQQHLQTATCTSRANKKTLTLAIREQKWISRRFKHEQHGLETKALPFALHCLLGKGKECMAIENWSGQLRSTSAGVCTHIAADPDKTSNYLPHIYAVQAKNDIDTCQYLHSNSIHLIQGLGGPQCLWRDTTIQACLGHSLKPLTLKLKHASARSYAR
jgi:hypothetical protein